MLVIHRQGVFTSSSKLFSNPLSPTVADPPPSMANNSLRLCMPRNISSASSTISRLFSRSTCASQSRSAPNRNSGELHVRAVLSFWMSWEIP